jgi:hypothetical protein
MDGGWNWANRSRQRIAKIDALTRCDMTIHEIKDPNAPISEVLSRASSEAVVLPTQDDDTFVILRLDDDLYDFLIERDPKFIQECTEIRERMRAGNRVSHEEVKRRFGDETVD